MNKYKVICYPNVNSYETEIEADTIEEAIELANEEAEQNCCFFATEKDVEQIKE